MGEANSPTLSSMGKECEMFRFLDENGDCVNVTAVKTSGIKETYTLDEEISFIVVNASFEKTAEEDVYRCFFIEEGGDSIGGEKDNILILSKQDKASFFVMTSRLSLLSRILDLEVRRCVLQNNILECTTIWKATARYYGDVPCLEHLEN